MEIPAFERPESPPKREQDRRDEREAAQKMFGLAEDVGDLIDRRIRKLAGSNQLTPFEITRAADDARRMVFSRGCEVLGVSEATREAILAGDD